MSSPVQLVALDGRGQRFAATLREKEAKILLIDGSEVAEIDAPPGCTSPITVAPGDVNTDDWLDLLVLDSTCQGWVGVGGTDPSSWRPEPWERFLPPLTVADQLLVRDLDGDGDVDLATASAMGVWGATRTADDEWSAFAYSLPPPVVNRAMANTFAIPTGNADEASVVLQQPGRLTSLSLGSQGVTVTSLPQFELEFLKAFDGFDQFTPVARLEECDLFAVAAGFFDNVARAPKPMVSLKFAPQGFVAKRVVTSSDHVIALGLVELEAASYIGILEGSSSGFLLEVVERRGCDAFTSRLVAPVEFGVSGLRPIPESLSELAASSGEFFVAGEDSGRLVFSHFDGKALRQFRVTIGSWELDEEKHEY